MKKIELSLENFYRHFDCKGFGRQEIRKLFVLRVDRRLAAGDEMSDQTQKDYDFCRYEHDVRRIRNIPCRQPAVLGNK